MSWALERWYAATRPIALKEALQQLEEGKAVGTNFVFSSLLQQCAKERALAEGKRLHLHIKRVGQDRDPLLGNRLLQMYSRCGSLEDAQQVFQKIETKTVFSWNLLIAAYAQQRHMQDARTLFEEMPDRDVVSWNSVIGGYAKNGQCAQALELFRAMDLNGTLPDRITFSGVLEACDSLAAGRRIQEVIEDSFFELDLQVGTATVNMYARCKSLEDARMMFEKLPQKDVVLWTSMVSAYAQNGFIEESRILFHRMPQYAVVTWNAVITAYAQAGIWDEARELFERMPHRDVVSWTALIATYAQNGLGEEALQLLSIMDVEGVPPNRVTFLAALDACTCISALAEGRDIHAKIIDDGLEIDSMIKTTIINMYGKCESLGDAQRAFNDISLLNLESWNAIIAAYAQNGHGVEAFKLLRAMDFEGFQPNRITFISILDACSDLAEGKFVHAMILERGMESHLAVGSALLSMYGKWGSLENATMMFQKMPHEDVVSWSSMIEAYAKNGHLREVLLYLQLMVLEGTKPNVITFISVLSVCSHGGLLEIGRRCFISMMQDHDVLPVADHYICVIDLLTRVGLLDDAEDLMNNMPFEPGIEVWTMILGSCRIHKEAARGFGIVQRALELDLKSSAPFVLLRNLYSDCDNPSEATKVVELEIEGRKLSLPCERTSESADEVMTNPQIRRKRNQYQVRM